MLTNKDLINKNMIFSVQKRLAMANVCIYQQSRSNQHWEDVYFGGSKSIIHPATLLASMTRLDFPIALAMVCETGARVVQVCVSKYRKCDKW